MLIILLPIAGFMSGKLAALICGFGELNLFELSQPPWFEIYSLIVGMLMGALIHFKNRPAG